MKINAETITVVGLLASKAVAGAVYSTFWKFGARIGNKNFAVSNTGCFVIAGAQNLSFSANIGHNEYNGPYCLHAFNHTGCVGFRASAQYEGLRRGKAYPVPAELADVVFWKWSATGCEHPIRTIGPYEGK